MQSLANPERMPASISLQKRGRKQKNKNGQYKNSGTWKQPIPHEI